jgi:hypothetical protein
MALPKLNSTPQYSCVIPSTKETVNYRPYLVKEEKILMIGFETGDQKAALTAIINTLEACIEGDIKVSDLTTFDVEYLFTQVRSRSVGEGATILVPCTSCGHKNEITVELSSIEIEYPENFNSKIVITDQVSVEMKYPSYSDVLQMNFDGDQTEMGMQILAQSIDAILTEDERISTKDVGAQEVMDFIESMTSDQFKKMSDFLESLPSLKKDIKQPCLDCGETIERRLQGINDFLS